MSSDLMQLKGVGPHLVKKLQALHIYNRVDLLFHLPYRYQDRTRIYPIAELTPGMYALIEAEIVKQQILFGKKRRLEIQLADQTGYIYLSLFHFSENLRKQLQTGKRLRCFGEISFFNRRLQMVHPEYQFIETPTVMDAPQTLTPIYKSTEGLSQKTWRGLINQVLAQRSQLLLTDYLPSYLCHDYSLWDALIYCHQPPKDANQALLEAGQHSAQQRLALEELLAHHLSLQKSKEAIKRYIAPPLNCSEVLLKNFYQQTPFIPTQAQERVLQEIFLDLKQNQPMLRLLQGDVGAGKTWVAIGSMLPAIAEGYQVAFMAPTEILAQQHYVHLKKYFDPLNIPLACLSSQIKMSEKKSICEAIANNHVKVVVGTHALIQESVMFHRLGLVIIDEQHRFGVEQRLALHAKGQHPHQLMMTATPIPRTLAMTAYADLDYSVIDELPPNRKTIKTIVIPSKRRQEIIDKIRERCKQKQQVYWVCTLILESETLPCQAAVMTYETLKTLLPELRIGLVHGQLKSCEKDKIMHEFKAGEIQVLVATTVIEVGVDVPNATLMIIENPERLGLAQLHQLRGRVGRGADESHCILMYQSPLSYHAKMRLDILRKSTDGFVIAEKDLDLRGSGELLGTKQSGILAFKIAQLSRDKTLLKKIPALAEYLQTHHKENINSFIARWLGNKLEYRKT